MGEWKQNVIGECGAYQVSRKTSPDGDRFVDVRRTFTNADGERKPTSKGVCVSFDLWPEIAELVATAIGGEA